MWQYVHTRGAFAPRPKILTIRPKCLLIADTGTEYRPGMRLLILAATAALFVSACSSDDNSTEPASDGNGTTASDDASDSADGSDNESTSGIDDGTDEGGTSTDGTSLPPQAFCTPCDSDMDCGEGKFCKDDVRGLGFCTSRCEYVGSNVCVGRSYCKQFGNETNSFYCAPTAGICESDGLDCAPCQGSGDCIEGRTCIEPYGEITFCAKPCDSSADCEYDGMGCGKAENLPGNFCLPVIAGVPTPKCGARPLDFCEQCETDGQCRSGLCVESEDIGKICSRTCDSTDNCPNGTDCVQEACVPPIAYGCQGFLGCLGVECEGGQLCYNGFCVSGP